MLTELRGLRRTHNSDINSETSSSSQPTDPDPGSFLLQAHTAWLLSRLLFASFLQQKIYNKNDAKENCAFLTCNSSPWVYILGKGEDFLYCSSVVGWTGPRGTKEALLLPGVAFISDVTSEPQEEAGISWCLHEKHLQNYGIGDLETSFWVDYCEALQEKAKTPISSKNTPPPYHYLHHKRRVY